MDKLLPLPCPLCGADGIVYALDGYRPSSPKTYKPYCSADCGIYASVEFMSEDSAVKWWNRRVPTERAPQGQPLDDKVRHAIGHLLNSYYRRYGPIDAYKTVTEWIQSWDAAKEGGEEASVATVGEAAQKVASSLAIAMLEDNLKKGRSIHIPSLGITIEGESQPGDTQP